MRFTVIKIIFFIILMVVFLGSAFTANNIIDGYFYSSLGVVSGTIVSKYVSNQTQVKNEKY